MFYLKKIKKIQFHFNFCNIFFLFIYRAEVAYGNRSSRPSLIGERPLQIRDYLFISAAYFCSFCNVGFMNAFSILGIELLKTFSNSKAIILIIPAIGIGLSSAAGNLTVFCSSYNISTERRQLFVSIDVSLLSVKYHAILGKIVKWLLQKQNEIYFSFCNISI